MITSIEFDFNLNKAMQSIVGFVFSSLILLLLLLLTENNLSTYFALHAELFYLALFTYLGIISFLGKRLVAAIFKKKPKIIINNDELLMPTFYLGIKHFSISEIYSLENILLKGKSIAVVLGVKNRSRYLVDKKRFSKDEDFEKFKGVVSEIIDGNIVGERKKSIGAIALSQSRSITLSTLTICLICALIFFHSIFGGKDLSINPTFVLMAAGAKNIFGSHEYYRIFSSTFVHLGVLHLLLNIFVLGVLGEILERVVSSLRFVNIFLTSSLFAFIFFVIFSKFEMGVGASGGIFGLWGAYFYLKKNYEEYLPGSVNALTFKRLIWVLIIEFLLEIFLFDNVGYFNHIGGLIAGFIYLYLAPLGPKLETIDQPVLAEKILFGVLVSAYSLGLGYFLLSYYEFI